MKIFKFLKDKLKGAIKKFSKDVEEEAEDVEITPEEAEEIPEPIPEPEEEEAAEPEEEPEKELEEAVEEEPVEIPPPEPEEEEEPEKVEEIVEEAIPEVAAPAFDGMREALEAYSDHELDKIINMARVYSKADRREDKIELLLKQPIEKVSSVLDAYAKQRKVPEEIPPPEEEPEPEEEQLEEPESEEEEQEPEEEKEEEPEPEEEKEEEPEPEEEKVEEEIEAPPEVKEKKGFFGRLFGKKKKEEKIEEEVPEEEVEEIPEPEPEEEKEPEPEKEIEQVEIAPPEEVEEEIEKAPSEITETDKELDEVDEEIEQIEEKYEPKEEEPEEPKKKGFFGKLKETVSGKKLSASKFEEIFFDLEVVLLENNVAVEVIEKIKADLKEGMVDKKLNRFQIENTILKTLKNSVDEILSIEPLDVLEQIRSKEGPFVIIFVGINGSGKTTTIAKMAQYFMDNDMKTVLVASDTFRAAAIQQLEEHANKLGVKIIKHDYGSDPAAVAFDGIKYAESKGLDVVLVDTAGRLHSNVNLMDEMKKIIRVAKPDMKIFIGESITGNDCVEQAQKFNEAVSLDGIVLSKADVDEKGGAALSVSYVTGKPILFLGTGQTYKDLQPFDKKVILDNLGL